MRSKRGYIKQQHLAMPAVGRRGEPKGRVCRNSTMKRDLPRLGKVECDILSVRRSIA